MIKTQTTKAEIIFIEVPRDTLGYDYNPVTGSFRVASKTDSYELCMVDKGFSMQGRLLLTRESQAINLVESVTVEGFDSPAYKNYKRHITSSKNCFLCPDNSLHSLAEASGVKDMIDTIVLYKILDQNANA